MSAWEKTLRRLRGGDLRLALRETWQDARARLIDGDRKVLVLRVDLTDAKNRLRARDRAAGLTLLPFDAAALPGLLAMLRSHEPARVAAVRRRWLEGMRGFVAMSGGAPVGYVFWTAGSDHPGRLVHSDLAWLGVQPRASELYMFDYYLIEPARGLGAPFARAVAEEHHLLGFTAAYGFVYAANTAALWLYKTSGWKTVRELTEHRLLSRLAVVEDELYWMHPYSRQAVLPLPGWSRRLLPGGPPPGEGES